MEKKFYFENRDNWKSVEKYMGNDWLTKTRTFEQTYQKIEWQVKTGERDIWQHLIQLRPRVSE